MQHRLLLYLRLVRLDKPIGILLLLWPTLWGLWVAGDGAPPWRVVAIFVLGTALMRSAGCAINDYFDRDFDLHVARTRDRVLTSGRIAPWEALVVAAALALVPDAGLWEFRGRERVHTHSAAMCWAACRRLAKIAGVLGLEDRGAYWREHADRIRKAILEQAWNPHRNSFVESFGGQDLDASLLLLQEIGFVAADDPRFIGTLDAITQELRRGNHLMRYVAPDDFGQPHTAFTICTFWYIDALAACGRRDEARAIFETLLASRNHLGMLSEDIDPRDGTLWGNFPQTYSMVGLIVCAMRLSKSWEESFWRGS